MFANKTITTGLLLMTGGALLACAIPAVSAAPLMPRPQEAAQQATTSQVVQVALPEGAQRPATAGDLASFNDALQQVARKNNGSIARSEVLLWTGDAAKTAVNDLAERMKAAGYTYAPMTPFDAEPGRVTAIAAMRGDKSDSVIGLWIETKDNRTLLVWGRYVEGEAPKTATVSQKAVAAVKKPTAIPKRTAPVKHVAAVKPRRTTTPTRRSYSSGSSASRQAQAFKAYQDYQYVKYFGPISGSMYRSSKW